MKKYKFWKPGSMQEKWGYDYFNGHKRTYQTLRILKEEFTGKLDKYLGNSIFPHKSTRMEKVKVKERLNFDLV